LSAVSLASAVNNNFFEAFGLGLGFICCVLGLVPQVLVNITGNRKFKNRKKPTARISIITYQVDVYAERVMSRAGLEEAKKGLRTGGSKLNNLRYMDDTTLTAENITDLQNLIAKVKGSSEEAGLF